MVKFLNKIQCIYLLLQTASRSNKQPFKNANVNPIDIFAYDFTYQPLKVQKYFTSERGT